MKKATYFLLAILVTFSSFSQGITGQWNGVLKVQGMKLRLVFNISQSNDGYRATMDSPDQKAIGIPVSTTTYENGVIKLAIPAASISYEGVLSKDQVLIGTFQQGAMAVPMNLSREAIEKKEVKRPQEPVKPFSYYTEDITFDNTSDGITLAGTLSLPTQEGTFPVVVLISGSGPQNRDEALLGHKPFLVLSDYLTKNGIAVLRYDDRGTAFSKGNFNSATTADFTKDAAAAVAYLKTRKEINPKMIGLVGHSEGGVIAPLVASTDKSVAFIVLLAGTGLPGDEVLLLQKALIERAAGMPEAEIAIGQKTNKGAFELVKKSKSNDQLKSDLTQYFQNIESKNPTAEKDKKAKEQETQAILNQLSSPWMQYFIKYDPATALKNVKCPVLAINGAKDLQVPPTENINAIKVALAKAGNKNVTTQIIPNLNHLFQECTTGSPEEYEAIQQTFAPAALTTVLEWIQLQTK